MQLRHRIAGLVGRRVPRLRISPLYARLGVVAAVVLILVAGVLLMGNPSGPLGRIEPLPPATGTVTRIPILGPGHRFLFFPISGRVTAGVKYRYLLSTHCGLDYPTGPDFDGSFWDSVDPAQRHTVANPPPGFAGPEDDGYMVLRSANTAEFHGSRGSTARYTRRNGAIVAGLCD
ncbi:MAG TPA: hypothetical protein VGR77_01235 [Candidatus Dormibacteraeota bacterium]|nr:hypothetical protein [Candidatus Dormibacteraeota bacterium]